MFLNESYKCVNKFKSELRGLWCQMRLRAAEEARLVAAICSGEMVSWKWTVEHFVCLTIGFSFCYQQTHTKGYRFIEFNSVNNMGRGSAAQVRWCKSNKRVWDLWGGKRPYALFTPAARETGRAGRHTGGSLWTCWGQTQAPNGDLTHDASFIDLRVALSVIIYL